MSTNFNNIAAMSEQTIDFNVWVTQSVLAKELGVTRFCIAQWIRRGKIEHMRIEPANVVLVNKNTITARKYTK